MKHIKFLWAVIFLPLLMHAQPMNSEVSVTINGNKNLQMSLDGKTIALNAGTVSGTVTSFSLNNLSIGQHAYIISRTDNSSNSTEKIAGIVNLRYGYDMTMVLNEDGSLELMESRKDGYTSVSQQPMGDAPFNTLLQQVRVQKSTATRRTIVAAAFEKQGNYFTTLQVEQLLKQISAESFRLSLAKDAFSRVTDPYNFGNIYSLLTSEASKKNLDAYISTYQRKPATAGAMAEVEFKRLYQGIQQQWPVSAQINSLNTTFANTNNYFTTYQAAQLIQLVTSESDRLKLAKASYANITDKANFNQIYEILNTQSSRNELDNYVKSQGGSTAGNTSSDNNFTNLYNAIQQQWPLSAQMNSLNDVFNNTNNSFTTNQAVQLIKLVSAETNRLQLAKASYRSISDKANFNQVYELLNTQGSRNELDNYVRGQGGATTSNAMSDTYFTNLYNTIEQQWPVSSQMSSLNAAFSNTNNNFTTYQTVQLIKLVSAENDRLQLAKASYRSITDKANFNQIYDLLNSQSSRNDLDNFVKGQGGSTAGNAISDNNFTNLYNGIQQQWPLSAQMNSLNDVFTNTNNSFTTNQAVQLIKLVSAEANRLQLAKASYRSITDKANFNQVYELLNTQSSRNELTEYVRNAGATEANTNVRQPVNDASFNKFYQAVQMQFLPFEKMNSISDVFTNTVDYFSTSQAKQLIQLISAENNRLSLAKMSYKKITDRNNFSQLYDVFQTPAFRDDLANYVRTYKD